MPASPRVAESTYWDPSWLLGSTVGRVAGLPVSLVVGQEKAPQMMGPSRVEDHRAAVARMGKAYPDQLRDVAVRLGGSNTWDDLQRIWKSDRTSLPMKMFGTYVTPIGNTVASLARSSFYNPLSNTATVYGGLPAHTAHELGHAVDFNNKTKLKRDLYTLARMPEQMVGLNSGPVTNLMEVQANRNAFRHGSPAEKADMWRRLAPAYSTYLTAAGLGGMALHRELTGGGEEHPLSRLLQGANDLYDSAAGDSPLAEMIRPAAVGAGLLVPGALAGRGVAEIRNALAGRGGGDEAKQQRKPEKSTKEKTVTSPAKTTNTAKRADDLYGAASDAVERLKAWIAQDPDRALRTLAPLGVGAAALPVGGLLGGLHGAATDARAGRGFARGALAGAGTVAGMAGGAALHGALGNPTDAGSLLLATGAGGLGGRGLTNMLMGPPRDPREKYAALNSRHLAVRVAARAYEAKKRAAAKAAAGPLEQAGELWNRGVDAAKEHVINPIADRVGQAAASKGVRDIGSNLSRAWNDSPALRYGTYGLGAGGALGLLSSMNSRKKKKQPLADTGTGAVLGGLAGLGVAGGMHLLGGGTGLGGLLKGPQKPPDAVDQAPVGLKDAPKVTPTNPMTTGGVMPEPTPEGTVAKGLERHFTGNEARRTALGNAAKLTGAAKAVTDPALAGPTGEGPTAQAGLVGGPGAAAMFGGVPSPEQVQKIRGQVQEVGRVDPNTDLPGARRELGDLRGQLAEATPGLPVPSAAATEEDLSGKFSPPAAVGGTVGGAAAQLAARPVLNRIAGRNATNEVAKRLQETGKGQAEFAAAAARQPGLVDEIARRTGPLTVGDANRLNSQLSALQLEKMNLSPTSPRLAIVDSKIRDLQNEIAKIRPLGANDVINELKGTQSQMLNKVVSDPDFKNFRLPRREAQALGVHNLGSGRLGHALTRGLGVNNPLWQTALFQGLGHGSAALNRSLIGQIRGPSQAPVAAADSLPPRPAESPLKGEPPAPNGLR